ncbi:extensin family protein [Tabrizicola sp.]|uniref:extensin-like domain-containing protein n=1 Tax=Tabrizicola sp. TaxID=2005166 RepID=UPI00286C7F57|nr:extensin family protein [Tabrizicola sp.]
MFAILATSGQAQVIDRSPRPMPKPVYAAAAVEAEAMPVAAADAPKGALLSSLRPMPRPKQLSAKVAAMAAANAAPGLDLSTPVEEPELAAVAPPSKKELRRKKREQSSMVGAVCGVPVIKGEEIAPIKSKVKGCGVPEAVRITSISGVRLSQAATVDCDTARALNTWVTDVVQPAFKGQVVELQVAAHYICRSRNNVKGAKISEHGKGKAIDIAGFVLSNGKSFTVLDNYNKTLRKVHKGACGIFQTTLGPGSDGYHENHLHLDTASYRGGAYCR